MILYGQGIQLALIKKQITIDPLPDSDCYSSTSVDLRLDDRINLFKKQKPALETIIDPDRPGFRAEEVIKELSDERQISDDGFVLAPKCSF